MTNEEAIKLLMQMKDGIIHVFEGDRNVALDMAISALQEEDVPDTNVGGMVSRQRAIDALKGLPTWWADEGGYYGGAQPPMVALLDPEDSVSAIENLPSAQPEPSEITDEQAILHLQSTGWMQNHDREMYESGLRKQLADDSGSYDSIIPCEDTISRQSAIDAVNSIDNLDAKVRGGIYFKLIGLPSAQSEIVRCKDCKHSEHWYRDKAMCFLWHETGIDVFEDGFCNYAERKES